MNWFSGDITGAVAASKKQNAIFVVYVEGNDELSRKMSAFINCENVKNKLESKHFVAIRIKSDSEAYMQFAQIYQLVPLPSLFFIGNNGVPIEVVTGIIQSEVELANKIENIVSKNSGVDVAAASQANIENLSTSASTSTSVENQQRIEKNAEHVNIVPTTDHAKANTNDNEDSKKLLEKKQADIERAKKILEEKRKENEAEQKRLEREAEIQRRRSGKDLQSFKKMQHEQELEELKNERRRQLIEDQQARQRILEKIASDRAEHAQKFGNVSSPDLSKNESNKKAEKINYNSSGTTRIQFRTPDGQQHVHVFKNSDKFQLVRSHVSNNILQNSTENFELATTFPKRNFSVNDNDLSLEELELIPSALILVLTTKNPQSSATAVAGSGFNFIRTVFWTLMSPVISAYNYMRNVIVNRGNRNENNTNNATRTQDQKTNDDTGARKRNLDRLLNNEASTSTSENSGGAYRRMGSNIHRLSDQKPDSDDETAFWNGNSTQQQ